MAKTIVTKSLRSVVRDIFENPRYLRSLKDDPKEGLKKAGIRLSRKDLRRLKRFLQMRSLEKDLRALKRIGQKFEEQLGIWPW